MYAFFFIYNLRRTRRFLNTLNGSLYNIQHFHLDFSVYVRLIVTISIVFIIGSVLCAPQELQNVDCDPSGERVVVLASAVLQVRVLFIIDHLVSG